MPHPAPGRLHTTPVWQALPSTAVSPGFGGVWVVHGGGTRGFFFLSVLAGSFSAAASSPCRATSSPCKATRSCGAAATCSVQSCSSITARDGSAIAINKKKKRNVLLPTRNNEKFFCIYSLLCLRGILPSSSDHQIQPSNDLVLLVELSNLISGVNGRHRLIPIQPESELSALRFE